MPALIHPGASLVSPYQQGKLDALCGLYALINAIRVIHALDHPLPGRACRSLFRAGIRALAADKHTAAAACDGLSAAQQYKLLKQLSRNQVLADRPLLRLSEQRQKLRTGHDIDLLIRTAIKRRAVLLVCVTGRMSHHTVITGVSGDRVVLCDSSGMQFVYVRSILPSEGNGTRLHVDQIAVLSI